MLRTWAVFAVIALSACGGCETEDHTGGYGQSVVVETPSAKDSESHPAYLEAYERAVEDVTLENVRKTLDELNREIDKDSE